jgi:hypothetical protein
LKKAKENGLSEEELKEVIIHLAFYAGWPESMSAINSDSLGLYFLVNGCRCFDFWGQSKTIFSSDTKPYVCVRETQLGVGTRFKGSSKL